MCILLKFITVRFFIPGQEMCQSIPGEFIKIEFSQKLKEIKNLLFGICNTLDILSEIELVKSKESDEEYFKQEIPDTSVFLESLKSLTLDLRSLFSKYK